MTSKQMPKITLHHLEASRSLRVLWLLEYLSVPYDLQFYPRDPETRYAKDTEPNSGKGLSAVHPLGRSPVLEVDGVVVAEAGAVLTVLLQHFPKQSEAASGAGDPRPMDLTREGQELNFWVQFGESSLFLHAIPFMYGFKGGVIDASSDGSSVYEKTCARGLKADLDHLENELGKKGGTLAGEGRVGPADICTEVSLEFIKTGILRRRPTSYWSTLGIEGALGPKTQAWMEKCQKDESYLRATEIEVKRGGKVHKSEDWLKPLYG
ncbi:hypothetical protein BCV69DRAFT_208729 [Microstroma glucosiphilum]|uniref:GST N-terminal domain-containing protein n=1 Tax=Pseudomicrostroma glucosiphilum TaxID=1684307 RepID=A0A316U573_9BASI|nr:hypothetical protein BCV69DRAFT_208729 [Pseudomicrostroma glucosiphilum]PWN20407.1 hypothetical protein BCV69DRAFT_208729 [Pseudomicrostroma glucosiphilum]